ncbi:hypothetical protein HUJ05_007720 [Dendroctonus ponderosae]|nr:hypothetical protein HUJ05_007720 [Dendroctonus ponderosae]
MQTSRLRMMIILSRKAREITSPTASSPLKMSTAVVDETSGRNSDRPRLQSPENIPKCNLTGPVGNQRAIDEGEFVTAEIHPSTFLCK